MCKHEEKNCPRCNKIFECKAGNINDCQCSNINLSVEEQSFIETKYQDCLCIDCLKDLKNKYVLFKEKFLLR
jgi:cysteine-rich CWC protein